MTLWASSDYQTFSRQHWRGLAQTTEFPLTAADVLRLRSLSDPIDLEEADLVYRTLSGILQVYVHGTVELHKATDSFLHSQTSRTPFVIGIAGSVAVGKSSTARLLQELLRRWPHTPRVELVTTDGFLYPNAVLEEKQLLHRKGFPESYDRRSLMKFLQAVKSGVQECEVPTYNHLTYDIVADKKQLVRHPDILIVEGINVLQPPRAGSDNSRAISDYFDFSIYVDAPAEYIEQWYIDRFMRLRATAFTNPKSYFYKYSKLSQQEAISTALEVWKSINLVNLEQNILPTRERAKLILEKSADHSVQRLHLRKL